MQRFLLACAFAAASSATNLAHSQASATSQRTLASLIAELEANNPELAGARREVDKHVARVAAAGAPPDPTLAAGSMQGFTRPPFFPTTDTPDAFWRVWLSQDIPFPGKLSLRSQVARADADASRWSAEDIRLKLIADLKATYFEYQFAWRALEIVSRNRRVLDAFRQITEARFGVGQAIQQDVLKAQLEISGLIERTTVLERQRDRLRARLNALLYRTQDAGIAPDLEFTVLPLPADASTLRGQALQRYPALKRDEQLIAASQQQVVLARKEYMPDFAITGGAQKMVGEGDEPWMYGIDFMVKIPIFWQSRQRPMLAGATAGLEASRRMRDNTLAQTESLATELYVTAASARSLMDLYSGSTLPQARLALESSLASYQVGKAEFLTVLANFTAVLNYEIGLEEQRMKYYAALSGLEPLVSTEFIK